MKRIISIIVISFLLYQCKSGQQDHQPLKGGEYTITSMAGQKTENDEFIQFDLDKQIVSGQAACNNFSGSFDTKKDSIGFGQMASTRKYCKDQMDEERKLMETMTEVEAYEYDGDQLLLLSSTGKTLLTTQKKEKEQ